jgi:hypothetical protein
MEFLALTSKVLYDNELLEVKKELDKLRKKYETPRVMFETWHDWEKTKMNMKMELWLFMVDKDIGLSQVSGETEVMYGTGLEQKIEQILEKITGNSYWSYGKADEIITGINDALSTIDSWVDDENILLRERNTELQRRIIHDIICKRLGVVDVPNERLLCMVPQFMCRRCNSVTDYVLPPAHICGDCEKIARMVRNSVMDLTIHPSVRLLMENSTIIDAPVGEECVICHEQYLENENARKLNICQHSFHSGCIENWFNERHNCPICREVIEE